MMSLKPCAGAVGYLLKDVPSEKLYEAINSAAHGEYFLQPSITAKVVAEFSRMSHLKPHSAQPIAVPLSVREIEILKLVATGANNKEISEILVIAEGTVKNHLTSILAKLEARPVSGCHQSPTAWINRHNQVM